jgi:hypothetical protein
MRSSFVSKRFAGLLSQKGSGIVGAIVVSAVVGIMVQFMHKYNENLITGKIRMRSSEWASQSLNDAYAISQQLFARGYVTVNASGFLVSGTNLRPSTANWVISSPGTASARLDFVFCPPTAYSGATLQSVYGSGSPPTALSSGCDTDPGPGVRMSTRVLQASVRASGGVSGHPCFPSSGAQLTGSSTMMRGGSTNEARYEDKTPVGAASALTTLYPDNGAHFIFVTEAVFQGNFGQGSFSGLAAADAICTNAAQNARLYAGYNQRGVMASIPGYPAGFPILQRLRPNATWKAILSDDTTDARDRITLTGNVRNLMPWVTGDGFCGQHFNTAANFWNGAARPAGIGFTENTFHATTAVNGSCTMNHGGIHTWLATQPNGTRRAGTCSNWTSLVGTSNAGDANAADNDLWQDGGSHMHNCNVPHNVTSFHPAGGLHLICISQGDQSDSF